MRHLLVAALKDASQPYLLGLLAQAPVTEHELMIKQVSAHRDFLADFCLSGYGGAGMLTVEFICALHRAIFPIGFKQEMQSRDGQPVVFIPGEYKSNGIGNCIDSVLFPGETQFF